MVLKNNNYWFIVFLFVLFASCDKNRVFDEYKELDGSWSKNDTLHFEFEQNDTINPYNLFLNIRNNNEYPFNNLFVIVSLKNPENEVKIDTLEYQMANADGSLMGTGFSDVKESKLWYQENFVFKKLGKYQVDIVHALRESREINGLEKVNGVTEVGFRIEKTK
ncbi:gliding motility lipoprotein GldH [Flavobacterium okayamense]|uniref:gliding motility lipoprotein GldH n=1 Tax=Flavobacterium okayamense TaxID=2830782 RepID=UPI001C840F42|nr:gliding motility lipoprotein GldH [Flavobacterium okayamense]